ncbi:MAG TPA: LysM peptidoglycan-binding domain-containing protein [Bacteroidia bacterium]|jgi:hypothetical protein|nr:LysM peptidoglycan-binding domain-containing protein [Bacteroidia bacterium]
MATGELAKMIITPYADGDFTKQSGAPYKVLVNPENFSLTYGTHTNTTSAQGSSEQTSNFNKRADQLLNFKFLFDGTGVIRSGDGGPGGVNITPTILGGGTKLDVTAEVQKFKNVVYNYSSVTHQPGFVQINWGTLLYNSQLTHMTISFKLFKPDGTPLRAEADCSFKGFVSSKKLAAIENRMSPDLTHIITVQAGDTLSLLCYREYGDSSYYNQVAKFNKLTDLKRLIPGTKLFFPPINNS